MRGMLCIRCTLRRDCLSVCLNCVITLKESFFLKLINPLGLITHLSFANQNKVLMKKTKVMTNLALCCFTSPCLCVTFLILLKGGEDKMKGVSNFIWSTISYWKSYILSPELLT